MKRIACFAVCLSVSAVVHGQPSVDRELLAKIRVEAMERSQVEPVFDMFTVAIGPRLTASPAHKRAAEWARDRLASYGLENSRLEPWHFGRGWTLEHLTVEMIEPRYLPLIGYADGWSASTKGEIVAAPVFLGGKSPEEVAAAAAENIVESVAKLWSLNLFGIFAADSRDGVGVYDAALQKIHGVIMLQLV